MLRVFLLLALASVALVSSLQAADDGPPISIVSPDAGVTYAYGSLLSHTLYWDNNNGTLMARVTFINNRQGSGASNEEDTHDFRLPGITYDSASKTFFATSAKGDKIPVARYKKQLFFSGVVPTANARIRVLYPRGNVSVILEAISPDDPAMHPKKPASSDSDGTHKVPLNSVFQN